MASLCDPVLSACIVCVRVCLSAHLKHLVHGRRFLFNIGGGPLIEAPKVERRRRDNRGAVGAEEGGVWGGGFPLPTIPPFPLGEVSGEPRKFFDCVT